MHAGYLGYVYLIATLILFTTGWEGVLAGGIRAREVWRFAAVTALFSFSHLTFPGLTVRGTVIPLALFLILSIKRLSSGLERAVVVGSGILLAGAGHLTGEWATAQPALILTTPEIDFALLLALVLGLGLRDPRYQLPVMTLALLLLDLINIAELPGYAEREWAGRAFWDEWWLTLWTARFFSVIVILHIGIWRILRGKWKPYGGIRKEP
ncbi:hypothetical protein [Gorillibacterium sp. CAU 1737]|uniref:hypothetical protein n=1 Tax=Gorillibacterium sp. CAU 1737 TaxID=3140362 RepID=UPI003260A974